MTTWKEFHKKSCRHCLATGKCGCGSCGIQTGEKLSTGLPKREGGTCSVCRGEKYFYPEPEFSRGGIRERRNNSEG